MLGDDVDVRRARVGAVGEDHDVPVHVGDAIPGRVGRAVSIERSVVSWRIRAVQVGVVASRVLAVRQDVRDAVERRPRAAGAHRQACDRKRDWRQR